METNWPWNWRFSSVQSLNRVQLFCNPMYCTGLPVRHQLPEFTQTHVHWGGDAIQPFHHLLSPSPPALNLSQHQGLFKWVSSLHEVAKVLEFQLQHQFPMNIQDWSPLGWTGGISLQSKGLSRVFSNTKSINSSALSFLYSPTLTSIQKMNEPKTTKMMLVRPSMTNLKMTVRDDYVVSACGPLSL